MNIDETKTPRPLERADHHRLSTKSGRARRERQVRNGYASANARGAAARQATPKPYGKEKFVRSSRFGAALLRGGHVRSIMAGKIALVDKDGNVQIERLPRGSQRDYSLDGLKVGQLRDLASRRGLKGLYTAKKAALITAIEKDRF